MNITRVETQRVSLSQVVKQLVNNVNPALVLPWKTAAPLSDMQAAEAQKAKPALLKLGYWLLLLIASFQTIFVATILFNQYQLQVIFLLPSWIYFIFSTPRVLPHFVHSAFFLLTAYLYLISLVLLLYLSLFDFLFHKVNYLLFQTNILF